MRKFFFLFLLAAISEVFVACTREGKNADSYPPADQTTTYMGVSVRFPVMFPDRAVKTRNNEVATYFGSDSLRTLDLYLLSADGNTIVYSQRYDGTTDEQLVYSNNENGYGMVSLYSPIKMTPGDIQIFAVLNSPTPLFTSIPGPNFAYTLNNSLNLSDLAMTDMTNFRTGEVSGETVTIYRDLVTFSGRYTGTFTVVDGVSRQEAAAGEGNNAAFDLVRIPARAIVTSTATLPAEIKGSNGITTIGTVDNLTWSVAQGGNAAFLFEQTVPGMTWINTPSYAYVPSTNYPVEAGNYFDYSDLNNIADPVPAKPEGLVATIVLPGKFLLPNTHATGADIESSGYRKGNTAYALVRAKFTPAAYPDGFTDNGVPPTDGTFYIGGNNGRIYTSIAAATDQSNGGMTGQSVMTYVRGKVLYYIWLNPDDISNPVNSPVVRNNIYHINIASINSIGYNWNPLNPSTGNPDPKPGGNAEPDSPVNPIDPLTSTDTFMDVTIGTVPWTFYSYDIEF